MSQLIIVPHPKRKKACLNLQVDNNGVKTFHILYDGCKDESKNEDPFIWNDRFLYTFCHGNDVFTRDLVSKCIVIGKKGIKNVKPEDIYITFVSPFDKEGTLAKGPLAIDTIIKIDKLIKLPQNGKLKSKNGQKVREKGEISRKSLKAILSKTPLKDSMESVIKYHFPGIDECTNNFIEHPRRQLWIAMGDENKSFLPMVKCNNSEYKPFAFNKEDSANIRKLIQGYDSNGNPHGYYVAKKGSKRIRKSLELSKIFSNIQNVIFNTINDNCNHPTVYKLKGKDIKEHRSDLCK